MDEQQPKDLAYPGHLARQAQSVKKATPADHIRDNAERAVARLSSLRSQVDSLKERLCGSVPMPPEATCRETMSASGFIGGTGNAIERAHIEITEIEGVLSAISEMI